MDDVLKKKLGLFYIGISGLYKVFFGEVEGLKKVNTVIFKKCKKGDNLLYIKSGWYDWPKNIKQNNILK